MVQLGGTILSKWESDLVTWGEATLGHRFGQPSLLVEAVTHTTYSNEHNAVRSNQRLEFLGDAVVGVIIGHHLFERFPVLPEGELTKIRAAVVCEPSLAASARRMAVGNWIRFGKGESVSGRDRDSILADAFEALVGALYLDGGFDAARKFVLWELDTLVQEARSGQVRIDYKTRLQELIQRQSAEGPVYRQLAEEGPAHNKRFHVGVYHRGELQGTGWGRNKKEAEQEAARKALKE